MKIEVWETVLLPPDGELVTVGSVDEGPIQLLKEDGHLVVRMPFADNICATDDERGAAKAIGELVAHRLRREWNSPVLT